MIWMGANKYKYKELKSRNAENCKYKKDRHDHIKSLRNYLFHEGFPVKEIFYNYDNEEWLSRQVANVQDRIETHFMQMRVNEMRKNCLPWYKRIFE